MVSESDDSSLILKLKENDINAFDSLYHKYNKALYFFAVSLLKDGDDARETVQEVFYRVWNRRNELDHSKSFKSFLFTISHNLIMDSLRLKLKDKRFREYLALNSVESITLHNHIDYETLNQRIEEAVKKLPEKRKIIYKMSREEGYSYKRIADELGISVKTVENQINLTLRHLRKHIGPDFFMFAYWCMIMNG